MTAKPPTRLDRRSAFVVWIDSGAAAAGERQVYGTVEHVQTSRRSAFSDVSELVGFLLEHAADAEPGSPSHEG